MTYIDFIKIATALLGVVAAGGGTVVFVNRVKKMTGLKGQSAMYFAWAVSASIAVLGAVVSGVITPESLNDPTQLILVVLAVIVSAEKQYEVNKPNG